MPQSTSLTAQAIVTGDKQLDRFLRSLPLKLQKKGVRKATRASAKIVLADAQRRAPRDTGHLANSLVVRTAKGSRGRRMPRGTFGHSVQTRGGTMFYGDEYYAGFVEYGTKQRRMKTKTGGKITSAGFLTQGLNRGRVEAQPFMRPALYENKRVIRTVFKRLLGIALREIAAEG